MKEKLNEAIGLSSYICLHLKNYFLQIFISICTLLAFMMVLWYSSQKMTQSKRGI